MSSRTIVIQMEITKEFGLERHWRVLNLAMVKSVTLTEIKFTTSFNILIMLRRIMQLQRMKWWL